MKAALLVRPASVLAISEDGNETAVRFVIVPRNALLTWEGLWVIERN